MERGNGGQEVKSQQGMELRVLGLRKLGYLENTGRADTHKGNCRKIGSYKKRDKRKEPKTVRI